MRGACGRWMLVFLALLGCCGTSSFADVITVAAQDKEVSLSGNVDILGDPQGRLTLTDVLSNHALAWQPNPENEFSKGYTSWTWWLRISVINGDDQALRRYVEISNSVLDYVEVTVVKSNNQFETIPLGDKMPFGTRPIIHRNFLFPLSWQPGETLTLYFRVVTSSSMSVPIKLWDDASFNASDSLRTMADGIYIGTLIVIAIFNLLIFAALREKVYLHYVCYVVSMLLFVTSLTGYAFRYLWPNATWWNDAAIIVFLSSIVIFSATFGQNFLNLHKYGKNFSVMIVSMVIGGVLLIVTSFMIPYSLSIVVAIPYAISGCVIGFYVGIYAYLRREPSARYYLIAWTAMLVGGIILAASRLDLIPNSWLSGYALQIGSSLEMVLFSFALAERINVERKLRDDAQADALLAQKKMMETLESRVQERTHELEKANHQLRKISDTDELTGMRNRRFLDSLLDTEWNRCLRYDHPLAILLVDLDHFKNVNDNHGHLMGDECLREVAKRLQDAMRWPSDQVARYGGEEFCAVLPETDLAGARVVAERIRRSIEETPIALQDCTINITTSIGLVVEIPRASDGGVSAMIIAADKALYQSKTDGRNCITVASLAA